MKRGFTLLIAIVLTSLLLIVSFVVANVALKQVALNNVGKSSQYSFYNSDSGTDCAVYWDLTGNQSPFDPATTAGKITCNGQTITTGSQTLPIPGTPQTSVIGGASISKFSLNLPNGCVIVTVDKSAATTSVSSQGYDTCNTALAKRYERGITLKYDTLPTYSQPSYYAQSSYYSQASYVVTPLIAWSGAASGCANTDGSNGCQNLTTNKFINLTTTGTYNITLASAVTLKFRGAGGGGGGGGTGGAYPGDNPGGGGGGGACNVSAASPVSQSLTLTSANAYQFTVGSGGSGGNAGSGSSGGATEAKVTGGSSWLKWGGGGGGGGGGGNSGGGSHGTVSVGTGSSGGDGASGEGTGSGSSCGGGGGGGGHVHTAGYSYDENWNPVSPPGGSCYDNGNGWWCEVDYQGGNGGDGGSGSGGTGAWPTSTGGNGVPSNAGGGKGGQSGNSGCNPAPGGGAGGGGAVTYNGISGGGGGGGQGGSYCSGSNGRTGGVGGNGFMVVEYVSSP